MPTSPITSSSTQKATAFKRIKEKEKKKEIDVIKKKETLMMSVHTTLMVED